MYPRFFILTPLFYQFFIAYSILKNAPDAPLVRTYPLFSIALFSVWATQKNLTQVSRWRYLFNDASQRADNNYIKKETWS